jgi:Tol biopolymer transport system component
LGHLLFARDDTLMAQPFDPEARQLTGDPFPLAEHVSVEGSRYLGASVSQAGTLVYGHGDSLLAARQLTWFDRSGRMSGTVGEPSQYVGFALSPDERRIAVTSGSPDATQPNRDIWILDAARGVRSRQTFDPGIDEGPVWSPDGTRIAFGSERSGKFSLRQKVVDGTAADETLIEHAGSGQGASLSPNDWSADGRFIAYTVTTAFPRASDVWVLPLFGDRKPFPVAQTAFFENSGVFSPDGRWIAYSSNEAGQTNVYVQPFPAGIAKYQVSRDGGMGPHWRRDGRELFYVGGDGTIMAVRIDASGQFRAGEPEALFFSDALNNSFFQWAVAGDGKRFLLNARPQQSSSMPLSVVMNWTAPLQK